MTSATDVLREEHRVILRALTLVESAVARPPAGAMLSEEWWGRMAGWLQDFADHSHHAKEERGLFPALIRAGVPAEGGPVAVMLAEHGEGRALVQAIAGAPAGRIAAARRYVELLRDHIEKENEVLFPLADAILSDPDRDALLRMLEALPGDAGGDPRSGGGEAELDRLEAELAIVARET